MSNWWLFTVWYLIYVWYCFDAVCYIVWNFQWFRCTSCIHRKVHTVNAEAFFRPNTYGVPYILFYVKWQYCIIDFIYEPRCNECVNWWCFPVNLTHLINVFCHGSLAIPSLTNKFNSFHPRSARFLSWHGLVWYGTISTVHWTRSLQCIYKAKFAKSDWIIV